MKAKSRVKFEAFAFCLILVGFVLTGSGFPQGEMTPSEVLLKWRAAVHSEKQAHSHLAVLAGTSNQDGIPGRVEEWIEASSYRINTKRDYDDTEVVATQEFAKFRDWNGFVRDVRGKELMRLRTAMFEKGVIVFGLRRRCPAPVSRRAATRKPICFTLLLQAVHR